MHGSIWPLFHQPAGGYFAFKHLLRCSDDRTLPLVKKICDSIGFEAANRLWLDKVWTAGCFLCVDNWIDKCLAFIDISILFSNACNARDVAKEKLSRLFTELHLQNYSMSLFSRAIWTGDKVFFSWGKLAGAWLLATFENVTPILLWESKFSFHTHKLGWPVEILKHTFKYVAFSSTASYKLCEKWHVLRKIKEKLFFICPTSYPHNRTAWNNSPSPGPKGWTCPGGEW